MFGRRVNQSTPPTGEYEISDSTLRALDHGVGELRFEGELMGHLASIVGEIRFPSRAPWPWYLVIWVDGTREDSFEDYGPGWYTVRELDAGYLDFQEPSTRWEKVFLGSRYYRTTSGADRRYDFARLPVDEAAQKWIELGLADSDF